MRAQAWVCGGMETPRLRQQRYHQHQSWWGKAVAERPVAQEGTEAQEELWRGALDDQQEQAPSGLRSELEGMRCHLPCFLNWPGEGQGLSLLGTQCVLGTVSVVCHGRVGGYMSVTIVLIKCLQWPRLS